MTKSCELIEQLRKLGRKLDGPNDPETMRFLLHGRRALYAAIEASRVTEAPARTRTSK